MEGFSERLKLNTTEETGLYGRSFNHMMDSLEESYNQQKQFVEDASMSSGRRCRLSRDILSSSAGGENTNLEVLDESLNISLDELRRINKLVEELRC